MVVKACRDEISVMLRRGEVFSAELVYICLAPLLLPREINFRAISSALDERFVGDRNAEGIPYRLLTSEGLH